MFDADNTDDIPEAELIDDAAADCLAPMPLDVRGRRRPRCTAQADRSGVMLRIDDDANPEFWAEVRLERHGLFELMHRIMSAQRLDPF